MDSAKVKRLLLELRMVLEVTLVMDREMLNVSWAPNHSRKHCKWEEWEAWDRVGLGWECWESDTDHATQPPSCAAAIAASHSPCCSAICIPRS